MWVHGSFGLLFCRVWGHKKVFIAVSFADIPTLRTSSAPTLEGSFDLPTEFRIWGVGLRFSFGFIELGGLRPVVEPVHPNRAIREAPTVALHLCI